MIKPSEKQRSYEQNLIRKGFWISSVALILFALLAYGVASGATLSFDQAVLQAINHFSSPALDTFFVAVTQLGGILVVTTVTLALVLYLLYKKSYPKALLVAVGVGGAALINFMLKAVFERARPDLWTWIIAETNFSFPSGHSVASAALALCIVAILWRTKWRTVAIILGALYVVTIGVSRMYLGVHYPTDILGGWLLAVTWVTLVTTFLYAFVYNRRARIEASS